MSIDWFVIQNYYGQIAHLYDNTRPLPPEVSAKICNCILKLVKATPETKFLEPGIGTGRIGFPIIKQGYDYTGIDISEAMMNQLRGKFSEMPENLTLIQGDAANLPFADNSFDAILTTHILHCIDDPLVGLTEIKRVLKPNGVYLSCEHLHCSYQEEFFQAFNKIIAKYRETSQHKKEKISPFGEEMQQKLVEMGAEVEKVTAARWQQSQTVGELFNMYRSRAFGVCWLIEEDEFNQAIQEFKNWCDNTYKSEGIILTDELIFNITVARNWN
ncbi:MAG: class I SAM-dependent methyltransferase [Xenococcaceae cyanobacterium MO_188.B29]|nr:class I SAM-dependent methyltransferase [Xenococcaceae cyanobacterium MO_188.B29]